MRKEIAAFQSLDNVHIAKIEHFETTAQGLVYYTRYCRQGSLHAFLKENSVSTAEAVEYMRQLLEGLRAMHDIDLIHRDLKPQNILMQDEMHLLITDLGLVYMQGGHSTVTGLGTPGWIAPELLRGAKPDKRSDIYSLGLVFQHILKNTHDVTKLQDLLADELIPMMCHPDPDKRLQRCEEVEHTIEYAEKEAEAIVQQHQEELQRRQRQLMAGQYPYQGNGSPAYPYLPQAGRGPRIYNN